MSLTYLIIGLFALIICVFIIAMVAMVAQHKQLRRYTDINIGMSENEMLSIMGGGYNVSSLKNNRKKYEWRINASSYGYKGYRTYSGVHKVAIYTKDGRVEEIKPYNV